MPITNTSEKTKIQVRTDVTEPSQFAVVYINDDHTSFDFVIASLIGIFSFDAEAAYAMARTIHEEGRGVVAILPYETAEQKSLEVMALAKIAGFPLVARVEELN